MSNLANLIIRLKDIVSSKYKEEELFWKKSIDEYIEWYEGVKNNLYGHPSPDNRQKITVSTIKDSAILTWLNVHQKPKYLKDLGLNSNVFKDMKILDIGSGPLPSGLCFKGSEIYCLDPLWDKYLKAGYPVHYYDHFKLIRAYSEDIPCLDNYFDAVISVNAIDHVDDLSKTSLEIERVLKPGGKLAMHVHYHRATSTEPLEINDEIFLKEFSWCRGFKKISTSNKKFGSSAKEGETFALWRNF